MLGLFRNDYILEPNTLGSGEGTAAAAPPPFRPSDPALCGSRPLVAPYSRLGDLLCLFCVYRFVCHYCLCICVFSCFRCFLFLL